MKKVALITGGGEGIGLACATLLSNQGFQTVITGRTEEKLQRAAAEIPDCLPVVADMAIEKDAHRAFELAANGSLGIELVVHSAGSFFVGSVADTELQKFQEYTFSQLAMTYLTNRLAIMDVVPGGAVINISSRAALLADMLGERYPYNVAKLAQAAIAETINKEQDSVRFFTLCLGAIDTKMGHQAAASQGVTLDSKEILAPKKVAEKVFWLYQNGKPKEAAVWRYTLDDKTRTKEEFGPADQPSWENWG